MSFFYTLFAASVVLFIIIAIIWSMSEPFVDPDDPDDIDWDI